MNAITWKTLSPNTRNISWEPGIVMPGSRLTGFFQVIAMLIFDVSNRHAKIPANLTSLANQASPPHGMDPKYHYISRDFAGSLLSNRPKGKRIGNKVSSVACMFLSLCIFKTCVRDVYPESPLNIGYPDNINTYGCPFWCPFWCPY